MPASPQQAEAVASYRGARLPGVGGGAGLPQECVCLSPGTPCPHLFPKDTLAPRDTVPAVPAVLAFLHIRPELFDFRGQDRQMPWPPRWALALALTREEGKEAGPPGTEKRPLTSTPLLRRSPPAGLPSSRSPILKLAQSLKRRVSVSLLAECPLSPQARLIFPSEGLLCPLFPLSTPAE